VFLFSYDQRSCTYHTNSGYEIFQDPESNQWGFIIMNEHSIVDGSVSCYTSKEMARSDLEKKMIHYRTLPIESATSWLKTA
jgi:hypothetical protein